MYYAGANPPNISIKVDYVLQTLLQIILYIKTDIHIDIFFAIISASKTILKPTSSEKKFFQI